MVVLLNPISLQIEIDKQTQNSGWVLLHVGATWESHHSLVGTRQGLFCCSLEQKNCLETIFSPKFFGNTLVKCKQWGLDQIIEVNLQGPLPGLLVMVHVLQNVLAPE